MHFEDVSLVVRICSPESFHSLRAILLKSHTLENFHSLRVILLKSHTSEESYS